MAGLAEARHKAREEQPQAPHSSHATPERAAGATVDSQCRNPETLPREEGGKALAKRQQEVRAFYKRWEKSWGRCLPGLAERGG